MKTFIDDRAPKTREYVRYIFTELLKHAPLTKGANIEIDIIENKTPFPKLVEIPEGAPNVKRMSKELSNWDVRHPGRFALLWDFTKEILGSSCTILESPLQPKIRLEITFNVVINDPEKVYAEADKYGIDLEKIFTDMGENMENKMTKKDVTLHLSSNGHLWREPKDDYCYKMRKSKKRYKTVLYLTKHRGYQSIDTLQKTFHYEKEKTLENEMNKIRNTISEELGIDGFELIQHTKADGYRINPKYNILVEDF